MYNKAELFLCAERAKTGHNTKLSKQMGYSKKIFALRAPKQKGYD